MKSRAIVLHTIKYNDESLIANLLTEQKGCVDMIIRISRSKRAQVRHSLFQPLAILNVEWDNNKRSLQRPKTVQTEIPFSTLPYNPHKSAIALFLAEFLYHAVRREPESQYLFEYICRSIEWLDACNEGFANFHLVFLLRLTRFLGFMPNMENTSKDSYFDMRASCFTKQPPLHSDYLSPADAALVPKLMRMRYDNMRIFKFNGAERSRLLEYINCYYRLHLPDFPEINSLQILRELFNTP